jgi:heme/copper-type cytochrome/quinol oxidase subunit 1
MPRLTVWMIRAALFYLAVGFTLGGLLLFNKGVPLSAGIWQLLPAHIEFMLFGWIVQLVMGMAFWILPRFSHNASRGNVRLAWLAGILLNLGIWLVAYGSMVAWQPPTTIAGRACEVLSVADFAVYAWPRVKASGVK